MKIAAAIFLILFYALPARTQQIFAGTESADITFKLPAALQGQFHLRIGDSIESPLTANALAIESVKSGAPSDTVIFVSCDLTFITSELSLAVRGEIKKRQPGFNVNKIIVTATHTHTVPVYGKGEPTYPIPPNITQPHDYFDFLASRIADVALGAWKKRQQVTVSWGLGHAIVANNRRAMYNNGKTAMYGKTNTAAFKNIEGMEDHGVNAMFFENMKGKLVAVGLNVACPAQEVEGHTAVNADFWHDVRTALRKRWGKDLAVIGWIGAGGDQSPHFLYRAAAENRMIKLAGRTRVQEIAHRVDLTLAETYSLVKKEQHSDVTFIHQMDSVELPARIVTEKEYQDSKKMADSIKIYLTAHPEGRTKYQMEMKWHQEVVNRFNKQIGITRPVINTEIHAVRIGDAVIATNEFELFTDYGVRMQARSKALQTFVVQLAVGYYIYLPTEIAVKGGGYSAIVQSCFVNPEGGDVLTNATVELVNKLFP